MTAALAQIEMFRFLASTHPEVLSVSGRWGVGKTYAWAKALNECREQGTCPRKRYSYVSAFGVSSIKELKQAVFQSTVRLDGNAIEPTVDSFRENLRTIEGASRLAEWTGRRLSKASSSLVSLIPWAGSAGDLILPTASLLIRDQIVCIDDLERSGNGLSIVEVLGFATELKETRNCKVVLLLNKDRLNGELSQFDGYLEKVADQAIVFEPLPIESANIALEQDDELGQKLLSLVVKLGITNIRVIRRIRRFVSHLEGQFASWHPSTVEQAIQSLALFGWSIFEPDQAPSMASIRSYNRYQGFFETDEGSGDEESQSLSHLMQAYGFVGVDDFDEVLIEGLENGAFNLAKLGEQAQTLNDQFDNAAAREVIASPWELFGGTFDDNRDSIETAIREAVNNHALNVSPSEINGYYDLLCDIGRSEAADEILSSYIQYSEDRPRSFFEPSSHPSFFRRANDNVRSAFEAALAARPLERNPIEVLSGIETNSGWNPDDIEFLASLPTEKLVEIYKSLEGNQLRTALRASMRFIDSNSGPQSYQQFGQRVRQALERIAAESNLNAIRIRSYLGPDH
ncbi:hypothetical protein [Qipengyuania sp. JC766]|uniref:hypothetical protein n=1 Tax=Qipengyuania sp. JC766 TaxID=3232139 RepID=UPI0034593CFD